VRDRVGGVQQSVKSRVHDKPIQHRCCLGTHRQRNAHEGGTTLDPMQSTSHRPLHWTDNAPMFVPRASTLAAYAGSNAQASRVHFGGSHAGWATQTPHVHFGGSCKLGSYRAPCGARHPGGYWLLTAGVSVHRSLYFSRPVHGGRIGRSTMWSLEWAHFRLEWSSNA
jgi:hypothetical protein